MFVSLKLSILSVCIKLHTLQNTTNYLAKKSTRERCGITKSTLRHELKLSTLLLIVNE